MQQIPMDKFKIRTFSKNSFREDRLDLCGKCGGKGIDPDDMSKICPLCRGMKVLNHFVATFSVDVPYTNERRRTKQKELIIDGFENIYEKLFLESE